MKCRARGLRRDFFEALRAGRRKFPEKAAIADSERKLSYDQAFCYANGMAAWLAEMNVKAGDTVLACLPNCVYAPVAFAACEVCGARIALSAPTVADSETARRVRLAKPRACVALRGSAPAKVAVDMGVAVVCPDDLHGWEMRGQPARAGALTVESTHVEPGELLVFTSGSTGLPKAVVCETASLFENGGRMNASYGGSESDVFFVPPPFTHVFGLLGLCAALREGAEALTMRKFEPKAALCLMDAANATIEYGVSAMLSRQLSAAGDSGESLLETFVVGGDSCPAERMEAFERRFGCVVVQSWGMTEAASTITTTSRTAPIEVRRESVGFPVEGMQVRVDPATGELLCKSDGLARGFLDEHGVRPLPVDVDGWFRTGDLGSVGEDGAVRIAGRLKDVIIRGGMNIYPAEVERVYREHPSIADCCLVGFPDKELGERTCLCAVLRSGCSLGSREARAWGMDRIEKCRLPDVVLPMGSLPCLSNGKVDKQALRRKAAQWVGISFPQFK